MDTLPLENYYSAKLETHKNDAGSAKESCLNAFNSEDLITQSSSLKPEKKSTDSWKSHKEAERRRRQRINQHLSTLRTLLPSTMKTDKASLLSEVVHHLKELKRQAIEAARSTTDIFHSGFGLETEDYWPFPGEKDEVTLSYNTGSQANIIRVSVCCEDRVGFNHDLAQAIGLVRAKAVRAEMLTVGGRIKSVVFMQWAAGGGGEDEVGVLRKALKGVVGNRWLGSGLGPMVHVNKRARFYGLDCNSGGKKN